MLCRLLAVLFCVLLAAPRSALACTLFAAQGEAVQGNGTLIAKVRDYTPGPQVLKINAKGTYRLYGLYRETSTGKHSLVAGVNEKGLVVITATAGSIPKKQRELHDYRPAITKMLQNNATVAEAIENNKALFGPRYFMLADPKEIAVIEVGEAGEISVKRTSNDYLTHTNYYLEPNFDYLNIKIGDSSRTRHERINELLAQGNNYTMEDFISYTQDQNDGPDNSIWRIGSRENITQTLGAFVVSLQQDGDFMLWVKYRPEVKDKGREKIIKATRASLFD